MILREYVITELRQGTSLIETNLERTRIRIMPGTAAVLNIAMTSALKHGANHGHSDSLDTIIGMDYFLEFTVTLGVTRINVHGLGEDAKMRSK
jgi:hypothetical protein